MVLVCVVAVAVDIVVVKIQINICNISAYIYKLTQNRIQPGYSEYKQTLSLCL